MPTQGFNIKTLSAAGFKLNVWDIGGQKSIRAYWKNYYDNTDALVYVIDTNDDAEDRILEANQQLSDLLGEPKLQDVPVLVFFNKQDATTSMSPDAMKGALPILSSPSFTSRTFHIQPCSAVTKEGLEEGFDWVVSAINPGGDEGAEGSTGK